MVELLVVIALIGIMMSIAAPAIISQMAHLRLTRSVRNVVSELNAARYKAIAKNSNHAVEFTLGATDSFQLQHWTAGAFADYPGRGAVELESGVNMFNISSPGDTTLRTSFSPNGSATATSLCMENSFDTTDRMKVTVSGATGLIKVETGC